MRPRIAIALLVIAVVAAAVGLNGDGDDGSSGGETGGVAGATERSTYVGPRDGGRSWLRSRAKQRSVVWAVGDAADGGPESREVAAMIRSHRVDRFLYLGDVYETGTAREFQGNYRPLYGRYDRRAGPTIGNHEWANVATGYVPYWTAARGKPPPFWYASAASGWQLISLNSNIPTSTDQLNWLRTLIEATPGYGTCRIAFMHHPRYSAGAHGDLPTLQGIFDELRGDASIALAGHDHDMQRFRPVDGITQFVQGAGGNWLYPVNRDDPRLTFFDDTHYGALRIKLRPGSAGVSFVARSGKALDRSAVTCQQG